MKNETACNVRPATVGQVKEICGVLAQAIPGDLTFEGATGILSQKHQLIGHVQEFFRNFTEIAEPQDQWAVFYTSSFFV